jgi:site-specific recombinase XerD
MLAEGGTMESALAACTQNTELRAHEGETRRFLRFATGIHDNYRYHIKAFAAFAQGRERSTVHELVRDYFEYLNTTDYSAATIRCRRQAVKDRLRRAISDAPEEEREAFEYRLRLLDRDPATKCPSGGKSQATVKTVSEQEYTRLIAGARSDRQRRFIEFLWTTGARVSEMTGIRRADCKPEGNVVAVRLRGKGNKRDAYKERTVYVTRAMYERIRETFTGEEYLFETQGGKPYTRNYVSNQIAKLTLHVLGRRLSAHKLRHSFATRQIQRTGRIRAVSEYLGHSDVTITLRIYDHDTLTPEDVLGAEAVA